MPDAHHYRRTRRGFTMVELIVTISILGILAAMVVPRFVGNDAFASRGFFDQATEMVRHAQKLAIARRQPISVCVTTNSVSVHAGAVATCAPLPAALPHPTTGGSLLSTAPTGVTLASARFTFDGLGRPSAPQNIALTSTIGGDPARGIVVERETGYVHN